MGEFLKKFFRLEDRIFDDVKPKGTTIDRVVDFCQRNSGKVPIIPAAIYGYTMSKLIHLQNNFIHLAPWRPEEFPAWHFPNYEFLVTASVAYIWMNFQLKYSRTKKIMKTLSPSSLSKQSKILPKILGLGLASVAIYAGADYLRDFFSNDFSRVSAQDYTHVKMTVALTSTAMIYLSVMLYGVGDFLGKAKDVVLSKFFEKKAFLYQIGRHYLDVFKPILDGFSFSKKQQNKLSEAVVESFTKRGVERKTKSLGHLLTHMNDEITEYGLLENVFEKVKHEQENSQQTYVNTGDLNVIIDFVDNNPKPSVQLYAAAILQKEHRKLSSFILDKLNQKYSEDLKVKSELHLFNSVFNYEHIDQETGELIKLINSQSKKKIVFGTEKKSIVYDFDSGIGRVILESDKDFFERFLLSRFIYWNLLESEKTNLSEFPINYFKNNGKFSAISLFIGGKQLENILKEKNNFSDHEDIAKELVSYIIKYQNVLTSKIQQNGKAFTMVNYKGEDHKVSIPKFSFSELLEKRAFGKKDSDCKQRFQKTCKSDELFDILKQYEKDLLKQEEFVCNHGDFTSSNIFYKKSEEGFVSIDPRPIMAPSLYDASTILIQAPFNMSLDKKREILKKATNKPVEVIDFFLFNAGFCEAGSDLGHNRNQEDFKRKICEIQELCKDKPYQEKVMNYLNNQLFF